MHLSEHDARAEKIREEERQKLIDAYMQQAIENSEEYGFLNVRGHEVPDPTVLEPPLGYIQQPDLMEMTRRMIRHEISRAAQDLEMETFDEADDFDIEDDPVDYTSPYEEFFDPPAGAPAGPPAEVPQHAQDPNQVPAPGSAPSTPPPAPPDQPN